MTLKASLLTAAVAAVAGCGSSLASPDGGGRADVGGISLDAAGVPPDLRVQLESAAATWTAAKGSCGVYSYDRRTLSVFGSGTSTEVEVRNDVATRRRYSTLSAVTPNDGGSAWTVVFDEMGTLVGYDKPSGFPPSTVEQLLAECVTILAKDSAAYTLAFEADPHGAPTTCIYRPVDCVDDCTAGITIASFACAPLSN
jgi:hypothetical protein